MIIELKKLCRCGKLIDYGLKYCSECVLKAEKDKRDSNRYYDKNVRKNGENKKYDQFYNSISKWDTSLPQCYLLSGGLCKSKGDYDEIKGKFNISKSK